MSNEDFLARWSRRKREAVESNREEEVAETKAEVSQAAPAPEDVDTSGEAQPKEPAFDLSKLPSLDQITAETDMRVFMQPGVPASLKTAALRRAWTADPAIRDFVGLAENSWDFTKPNSIAGFGALDPAEISKLLADFLKGVTPSEQPQEPKGAVHQRQVAELPAIQRSGASEANVAAQQPDANVAAEASHAANVENRPGSVALQKEKAGDSEVRSKGHGRALPK